MKLTLFLPFLAILVSISLFPEASADLMDEVRDLNVLRLRESPNGCPAPGLGGQCPDSNPIYYFKCCGNRNTSCCFRLQDWLTVLFIVLIVLIILGIIVNLIRCIFCY